VFKAIENAKPIGSMVNPIAEMEGVSAGALPDLGAFLPRWVKHLGRRRPPKDDWESDHERWLREAVLRLDGANGLERLARKTKQPQACLAWCEALVDRGDWAGALHAYDASAVLVGKSHQRSELLDGAALAAKQPNRSDLAERLAAAWHAAPTLARLLRWLVPSGAELIEIVRRRPVWDELTITPEDDAQFPRASLSWHEGHGLVLHCFEDDLSSGFFLVESGSRDRAGDRHCSWRPGSGTVAATTVR
jgi:hypothetical protein